MWCGAAAADAGGLEALVAALKGHEGNPGIQEWGARALSIITYESAPLRERAKQAGAKMQWLMGLSESMEQAKKVRTARRSNRLLIIPWPPRARSSRSLLSPSRSRTVVDRALWQAAATPLSKTGRPTATATATGRAPLIPATGRATGRAMPGGVRGY